MSDPKNGSDSGSPLFVFEADGTLRFSRHRTGDVTFGDVEYTHLEVPGVPGQQHAIGHFVFDAALNLKHAEHYGAYRLIHDHFFRQGLIDHPYGDADVAELLPIRRWAGGTTFEPVYLSGTRPAVVPAAQPLLR